MLLVVQRYTGDLKKFYEENLEMITEHWKDASVFTDAPLDPDIEHYAQLQSSGILDLVTAKHNQKLIGYAAFITAPDVFCRSKVTSHLHMIYVAKEHRKHGIAGALMTYATMHIPADCYFFPTPQGHGSNLKRANFVPIETMWAMVTKRAPSKDVH